MRRRLGPLWLLDAKKVRVVEEVVRHADRKVRMATLPVVNER
jgi:hypothetical protein